MKFGRAGQEEMGDIPDGLERVPGSGTPSLPAHQLPAGRIWVEMPESAMKVAAIHARVSSADQKADLDRRVARLC